MNLYKKTFALLQVKQLRWCLAPRGNSVALADHRKSGGADLTNRECPKYTSLNAYDICGVHCPELPKLFMRQMQSELKGPPTDPG